MNLDFQGTKRTFYFENIKTQKEKKHVFNNEFGLDILLNSLR